MEGSATDTLVIKHLPPELSDEEKEELLKYFGAKHVKCLSSKKNKFNIVFARFENKQVADHVLHRLHQLNVNGSCLSVEFTRRNDFDSKTKEQCLKDYKNEEQIENEKCYQKFLERLHTWHDSVNFKEPVPCHLRYQYPPPDDVILLNIAKVLATVPKFYTQVLHLMNKMNLPCPFGKELLPDLNIQLSTIISPCEKTVENVTVDAENSIPEQDVELESCESEISSDEETKKPKETIPDQINVRKKKAMNLPKFVKPITTHGATKQKKTNIDEVFEKITEEKEVKKIKLSHPLGDTISKIAVPETASTESSSAGFGYIRPIAKPTSPPKKIDVRDEREEERLEKPEIICITAEELAKNRIPEKDRSILSVFKNYAEGAPTCRLYIKNLAKTVTEEDLRFIYSRYIGEMDDGESNALDIRLMQEGRMKGQAFITLQSVQLAHTALKETNGYILKDKPLVVQFARSASK